MILTMLACQLLVSRIDIRDRDQEPGPMDRQDLANFRAQLGVGTEKKYFKRE